MNELGVGLVYFPGFERFLALYSSLIDVIEIEPQTFWYDKNGECNAFKYDLAVTDFLEKQEQPKLFHGVGYPVGGTCLPSQQHFNTLRCQVNTLKPEWISEHLSFNMFKEDGKAINAGFLLPPLQSTDGVNVAVANIKHYQAEMNRPFAFETGVNYLKPAKHEMPDGLFVRKVAEQADCHILLDLHNILANQRNGRQRVKDFLEYLPFERVIELHVGGGIYYKDYYLDAHSGPSDPELLSILEYAAGKLPNLKAIMFEIDPESFVKVPGAAIRDQLITMQKIWDKKGKFYKNNGNKRHVQAEYNFEENTTASDWEYTLGQLVLGRNPGNELANRLLKDSGIEIIKDLIFNFRGSVLISVLKLSTRLLRLSVGEALFNKYVNDFFYEAFPELLPVVLAEQFAAYLKLNNISYRYLDKVLEYELASIHTAIDKQIRNISFDFDPQPVFTALENAVLPPVQSAEKTVILQVVFEDVLLKSDLPSYSPVFHI